MNPIVILFIFGLALNIQVDACIGRNWTATSAKLKNNANEGMKKFTAYIDRLKTNYIQELIDLKFGATFDDIDSFVQYIERVEQRELERESIGEKRRDCTKDSLFEISVMLKNISQEYKKCATDQFDKLNAIDDALKDSIDEWSSCPLDLDPPLALICTQIPESTSEVCIELNKHLNQTTQLPLACGEDQSNARNKNLRVEAEDLVSRGIADATKCISDFQQAFKVTFDSFIDVAGNCQDNVE